MTMLKVAAITIGGSLLQGKIASNRGQKGAIGSGTVPQVEAGPAPEIAPVEGTEVLDFEDFSSESFAEPEIDQQEQQQQLIQQLIDAGYDPEALGIAGLAFGGPVYRSNGGGLESLIDLSNLDLTDLSDLLGLKPPSLDNPGPYQNEVVDMLLTKDYKIDLPKPSVPDQMGPYPDFETNSPPEVIADISSFEAEVPEIEIPEVPEVAAAQGPGLMEKFSNLDPTLQSTLISQGGQLLSNLLFPPEQKGSQVMTQTLPGNSARRRAAQMDIKPIQGSVRAADGGVLDRKMFAQNFMPDGGDITGPGGPKDDLIPVMASNGEYMLSKAAVDQAGQGNHAKGVAALEAFNALGNMRYG